MYCLICLNVKYLESNPGEFVSHTEYLPFHRKRSSNKGLICRTVAGSYRWVEQRRLTQSQNWGESSWHQCKKSVQTKISKLICRLSISDQTLKFFCSSKTRTALYVADPFFIKCKTNNPLTEVFSLQLVHSPDLQ